MADPWLAHHASKTVLDEVSTAMGVDLVSSCRDETMLATTDFVQPALLALDVAAFRVLETHGVRVVGAAGHSLGEFAALVAAGTLDLDAALEIVGVRGRAMQSAAEQRPGTMTALLGVGPEEAAALCDEVRGEDVLVVANENSPQQVVISGSVPAIERAEALAAERRTRAVRLKVAGAFHSDLM
jgi:[acyl-carrier-protein] S-malonyltransferase